jgi:hypothetical protein
MAEAAKQPDRLADLEERVHHLEDAVVALCHTDQLEQKVTSRVIDILQNDPLGSAPAPKKGPATDSPGSQAHANISMPQQAVPTAVALAEYHPAPAPLPQSNLTKVVEPIRLAMPLAGNMVNRVLPPSSIFRDIWWDLRVGYRMIRDPIYPMTLAGKVIPIFALLYLTIWPWFSSWTGLIGTVMNGLVYILVLYIAFKVIHRELHRYYDFAVKYRRL